MIRDDNWDDGAPGLAARLAGSTDWRRSAEIALGAARTVAPDCIIEVARPGRPPQRFGASAAESLTPAAEHPLQTGGVCRILSAAPPERRAALAEICALLCLVVDCAAHAQAQSQTEMRLRAMLDQLPVVIWAVDNEGLFTVSEGSGLRLLGTEPGQHVGLSVHEVYRDRPEVAEHIARALQGESFREMYTHLNRTFDCWFTPDARPDGSISGVVGVAVDVTELLSAQERVRQVSKLEWLGRLAGGIAHDFNNVLTVITGYTELARTELGPGHSADEYLADVLNGAERAAYLTRHLLAFARRQILTPRPIVVDTFVQNLVPRMEAELGPGVRLQLECESRCEIKADPTHLESVLLHLCQNSGEAMPDGGSMEVRLDTVALREHDLPDVPRTVPGTYAHIRLKDSGRGIAREHMYSIFEPFFSTKEVKGQGKSNGLGLAMCYGVIKQSGGYISIASEPGHGTAVHIFLPCHTAGKEAPEAMRIAADRPPADGATVLIAEDEPLVRSLAAHALLHEGFRVLEAGNGLEALRIADAFGGEIALLLTDLEMPGMGGLELADRMRREHANIRVIYMSGYTDDETIRDAGIDPKTDFVPKPFSPAALGQAVRAVLTRA